MSDRLGQELRGKICDIMGIYPEELKERLPNSFGEREAGLLIGLITRHTEQKVLEARIEELETLTVHDIYNANNVDERISILRAQLTELKDK